MLGFVAYRLYLSLKTHFTTKQYDAIKSNGRIKCSIDSFGKRRDRKIFEYIEQKHSKQEIIELYVSNFMYSHNEFLYESSIAQDNLNNWRRKKESRTKTFQDDLSKIVRLIETDKDKYKDFYKFPHCPNLLLHAYISNFISIETICILTNEFDLVFDSKGIYDDWILLIQKSIPFVKYKKSSIQEKISEFQEELAAMNLNSICSSSKITTY